MIESNVIITVNLMFYQSKTTAYIIWLSSH